MRRTDEIVHVDGVRRDFSPSLQRFKADGGLVQIPIDQQAGVTGVHHADAYTLKKMNAVQQVVMRPRQGHADDGPGRVHTRQGVVRGDEQGVAVICRSAGPHPIRGAVPEGLFCCEIIPDKGN